MRNGSSVAHSPEVEVALAWARPADRPAFDGLFVLDRRLADVVTTSSETTIGQLRLAWWRDMLGTPVEKWPGGEPLLANLQLSWGSDAQRLIPLVDGWEALLVAERLDADTVRAFSAGRKASWLALAQRLSLAAHSDAISRDASQWSLADLAAHLSDERERDEVIRTARSERRESEPLPRDLRPFQILGQLGRRAIDDGGRPLMTGRLEPLGVLRIGMFGR